MAIDAQIAVIGGGAAGLAAAISAAQSGCDVIVVERADRLGKRILATGNGRCNLSNAALDTEQGSAAYNDPRFVEDIISRVGFREISEFFTDLGLLIHVDTEGRAYPRTNSANSVVDILHNAISLLRITERTGLDIKRITHNHQDGKLVFEILADNGQTLTAAAVILATGPDIIPIIDVELEQHRLEPVLGPLHTQNAALKGLNGVRVRCAASLVQGERVIVREHGEVLFRDYGLSGIVVFELSRYLQPQHEVSLDYFPEYSHDELRVLISRRLVQLSGYPVDRFFDGLLHKRVAQAIMRSLDYSSRTPIENLQLTRLVQILKDHRFRVTDGPTRAQAQVMRGGLATGGFSSQTLECVKLPGLFIVGEAVDVDGRSGGYNLHWAWASGIVAGRAAACRTVANDYVTTREESG